MKNLIKHEYKHLLFHDITKTDEPLYHFKTNINNLSKLLALAIFKRRPHIYGKFIKNAEIKLGHKIIPYNPELI